MENPFSLSLQIYLFLVHHDISNSLYYLYAYYVFQYDVSERPDLVTRLKMKIYRTTWKLSGEPVVTARIYRALINH